MNCNNLMNKKEMCEFLKCSPRKVDYLREREGLPFIRIGGAIRFSIESVNQWVQTTASNNEPSDKQKAAWPIDA